MIENRYWATFVIELLVWVVLAWPAVLTLTVLSHLIGPQLTTLIFLLFVGAGMYVVVKAGQLADSVMDWVYHMPRKRLAKGLVYGAFPFFLLVASYVLLFNLFWNTFDSLGLVSKIGIMIIVIPLCLGIVIAGVISVSASIPRYMSPDESMFGDNNASKESKPSDDPRWVQFLCKPHPLPSDERRSVLIALVKSQENAGQMRNAGYQIARLIRHDVSRAIDLWSSIEWDPLWRSRLGELRMETNRQVLRHIGTNWEQQWLTLKGKLKFSEERSRSLAPGNAGYEVLKWLFDRSVALLLLIICGPLMAGVAVLIGMEQGTIDVLSKSRRVGRYGKLFWYVRFKVASGRFGLTSHFLLWTGLDKLPALVNVLRGSMSLIGPHVVYPGTIIMLVGSGKMTFDVWEERLCVKPGLFGKARLVGFFEERLPPCDELFALDLDYAKKASFRTDIRLLWKARWVVMNYLLPIAFWNLVRARTPEIPPIGIEDETEWRRVNLGQAKAAMMAIG